MIYSGKQYKELEEKYRKLKKENEIKEKQIKLLKVQNKQHQEVIHDLDKNNYRGQCETLRLENKCKIRVTHFDKIKTGYLCYLIVFQH